MEETSVQLTFFVSFVRSGRIPVNPRTYRKRIVKSIEPKLKRTEEQEATGQGKNGRVN